MNNLIAILLSLLLVTIFTEAVPVVRPLPPTKPISNYTESSTPFRNLAFDMKFGPQQVKSGLPEERYRWREGYVVHPDRAFTAEEHQIINDALYELSQILCVPVLMWPQDSNPTGDYVEIIRGPADSGCWAYVGRQGGRQDLNLQHNGCIHKYIVQHESIHALGYLHEQSRPDRDDHVNILWNNIIPDYQYAFDKEDSSLTFGVPYDILSVMHYESYAFTQNGQPTIVGKDGFQIPTNTIMTGNDIAKLQRMYNC
jgi:hypothetical protein